MGKNLHRDCLTMAVLSLLICSLTPYGQQASLAQGFPSQNPGGTVSPIVRVSSATNLRMPQYGNAPIMDAGTGTIIFDDGKEAIVYTNWHVVKDAAHGSTVITSDGRQWGAYILGRDEVNDLAALLIYSPGIKPIPVDPPTRLPNSVTVGGYGPNGQLRLVAGPPVKAYSQEGLVSIGASVRQGDSGGPAIADGKLVGVLWGASKDSVETMITTGAPLLRFHRSILGPKTEQVSLTRWGYSGGVCQSCSSCQGGQCSSGQCSSCPNGQCSSFQGMRDGESVYTSPTPTTVPQPTTQPQIDTLYQNQKSLENRFLSIQNSFSSIQKSVTTNNLVDKSASCTCGDKWAALDIRLKSIEEKIAAFKPCTCDHSATVPATVPAPDTTKTDQLTQKITDLEKEIDQLKKPSSAETDALTLEGIVKRVPK